jgi:hypothetical protein
MSNIQFQAASVSAVQKPSVAQTLGGLRKIKMKEV